jgi:hypothetical protein
MTRDEIGDFVTGWIEAWNRQDVEAVLAHFADDVQFISPTAAAVVGNPSVVGKVALRAYWLAALERISSLEFTLVRALYDTDRREVAIVYSREINGTRDRACELLTFDEVGLVVAGEVMHGAEA